MTGPTRDFHLTLYRQMVRIRIFEREATRLNTMGEIPGALHTCVGQEGEIVGACSALRTTDYMTGNHRSHGHPIAKGAAIPPLMAELMGKSTGVCGGKGGSMHLADFAVGSLGESGVVGSALPVATGAALASKTRGTDNVALAFFGDGGANIGTFHESLNLAGIWDLPIVYLCENNGYAHTTSFTYATAVESVADRAAAYGMPGVVVDGQDVVAVHDAVSEAVERARGGGGPTLVEALTYRFEEHAHGVIVSQPYRSEDEVERWRQRDPIQVLRDRLIAEGEAEETFALIDKQVEAEIAAAVEFGRQSAYPEPDAIFEDVFVQPLLEMKRRHVSPSQNSGRTFPRLGRPRAGEGRILTYLQAVSEAEEQEMARDERVILLGEDVRPGVYSTGTSLADLFGESRVLDTPISEAGFTGAAVGAAMVGMRPICHLGIAGFVYCAMDQIISQASKNRYLFGGQATIPLTIRVNMFYGTTSAAHHSDRPYPLFMASPGIKVLAPSSPYDLKGLMKSAVRDDDPVFVFEDSSLWTFKENVPEDDYTIPIGVAAVKRPGTDITVVAIAGAVPKALAAAAYLETQGVSVEVIDPRSLVPLDYDTIHDSVRKTGRLVVVDPAASTCSAASEIVATMSERAWADLKTSPRRLTAADVHIPFSPVLEKLIFPTADTITTVIEETLLASA